MQGTGYTVMEVAGEQGAEMQPGLAQVGGIKWVGVSWQRLGAQQAYLGRARATEQVRFVPERLPRQSGRGKTPWLSFPPTLQSPASASCSLSLAGSQVTWWGREMQSVGSAPHGAGSSRGRARMQLEANRQDWQTILLGEKKVRSLFHGFKKINSRSIEHLKVRNERIEALKKYRRIWLQPWSTQCFKEHTN